MPAGLTSRPIAGLNRLFSTASTSSRPATVCLFCSLASRRAQSLSRTRRKALYATRRAESTLSPANGTDPAPPDARAELAAALGELQRHAANHVNPFRVQLALRNLSETPGRESVRVAVLAAAKGSGSGRTAKELLRAILADPLKPAGEWEQRLGQHDSSRPLVVHVGRDEAGQGSTALEFSRESAVPELNVSSPSLDDLDFLLVESGLSGSADTRGSKDAVLNPTIDVSSSTTGDTLATTPVHKALLVGDGMIGAASLLSLRRLLQDRDTIAAAVNLRQYTPEDLAESHLIRVDVDSASKGIALFRQDIGKAIDYEKLWFGSGVPAVADWLKAGISSNDDGTTKTAVRSLVASILRDAAAAIRASEVEGTSTATCSPTASPSAVASLNEHLSDWAQSAHQELQEQLDTAFTGHKWRKLGWWKLFWRVDDVGMFSSELITRRFLPGAERDLIYLAGRLRGAGVTGDGNGATAPGQPAYPGPEPGSSPSDERGGGSRWPSHIPFTRAYLLAETAPALQALAQKLVAQSLATSALTTSLGALAYLSAFSAYEAGTVAALGLVWSLRRLQKKWEAARSYWEGEVREEGRKAVRASEASMARALDAPTGGGRETSDTELERAKDLVCRAEDALARLR